MGPFATINKKFQSTTSVKTRQKGLQNNCDPMLSTLKLAFLAGNSKVVGAEQQQEE